MRLRALLFDFDDTLAVDEAAGREAMHEAALFAATNHGAEPRRFVRAAEAEAGRLFRHSPFFGYCERIGISPAECLWGDFSDGGPGSEGLHAWALDFRRKVFEAALRDQLLDPPEGAGGLADEFGRARRKRSRLLPDALETLARLKQRFLLGLLTNGAPRLQREKLRASGLEGIFDAIVVSGELGAGKPEPRVFAAALEALGTPAAETLMVGNSLARDIAGAKAAGMPAVLLRVPGAEEFADVSPDFTIEGLHELPAIVAPLAATNPP